LPELLRRIAGGLPPMPELYRSMFGNNPLAILRLAGRPCSRSLADKHSTSTPADWPRRQFFFGQLNFRIPKNLYSFGVFQRGASHANSVRVRRFGTRCSAPVAVKLFVLS
jgi:hypothetical protein